MSSVARSRSPRDVRAGESWSAAQRLKNDLIFVAAAAALTLLPRLGRRTIGALGAALGHLAYGAWPAGRRLAAQNLARAFPSAGPADLRRRVRAVYRALGRNAADTLSLLDPQERPERTLAIPAGALAVLDQALAPNRGVVFVTGHLGPWERMACALAARGRPITAVVRGSYDPRFDRLLYDRLRGARGVETIDRGAPGAALSIVRALRRGRVVGFLIDLPGRVATVPATLFGHPTRVPIGPARIALRARAPVVLGTPAPTDDGKLGLDLAMIEYEDLHGHHDADQKLAQRMLDLLGQRILALADHWPWMHPSFLPIAGAIAGPDGDPID